MTSHSLWVTPHPGSSEPQPSTEAAAAPSLWNISQFAQRLVEKLYGGIFSADPKHILLFLTEHIMVVSDGVEGTWEAVRNLQTAVPVDSGRAGIGGEGGGDEGRMMTGSHPVPCSVSGNHNTLPRPCDLRSLKGSLLVTSLAPRFLHSEVAI